MKPTLKRQHIVQTALNDAELAALRKQADAEGLSMTAFIRQLIIKNASVRQAESRTPEKPD
jgi:predicted DNA binding CopG/RHH family protein